MTEAYQNENRITHTDRTSAVDHQQRLSSASLLANSSGIRGKDVQVAVQVGKT